MSATPVHSKPYRGAAVTHRSAVTAVDRLTAPTLVTLANVAGTTGSLAFNTAYKCAVAPGTPSGNGTTSNILSTTTTSDAVNTHTLRLTGVEVTGATYYDIFLSTDAAPKWVARLTAAQYAAGCTITAVGTVSATTAGANLIDIRVVGTGAANNATPFDFNNAFALSSITPVDCTGYAYAIIRPVPTLTPPETTGTLTVEVFDVGADGLFYKLGTNAFSFKTSAVLPLQQEYVIAVYGSPGIVVAASTLTGTGASYAIQVVPTDGL